MIAVRTLALAAALSMGVAGVAFARNPVFTATFEAPAAEAQVIAVSTVWNCEGNTCVSRASHGVNVRSCRQLAIETGGRITAYGDESRQLNADELNRCNGERRTQEARN